MLKANVFCNADKKQNAYSISWMKNGFFNSVYERKSKLKIFSNSEVCDQIAQVAENCSMKMYRSDEETNAGTNSWQDFTEIGSSSRWST